MVKSKNLKDKLNSRSVVEGIKYFKKLIRGHERILEAIGRL